MPYIIPSISHSLASIITGRTSCVRALQTRKHHMRTQHTCAGCSWLLPGGQRPRSDGHFHCHSHRHLHKAQQSDTPEEHMQSRTADRKSFTARSAAAAGYVFGSSRSALLLSTGRCLQRGLPTLLSRFNGLLSEVDPLLERSWQSLFKDLIDDSSLPASALDGVARSFVVSEVPRQKAAWAC